MTRSVARCKKCGHKVFKSYISALGGVWHPSCFSCTGCRNPIGDDRFLMFSGRPYHNQCLKCAGCKRSIKGNCTEAEGLPWHITCYKKQNHPKCSVCSKPLSRRYFLDFWGNAFCNTHQDYSTCASCNRIVCENLTGGGMKYPDGLLICNLCGLHGVSTLARAEKLMEEMRSALASVGLKLNKAQTPIKLCDRDELHKASRHDFHDERPLLGMARWTITSSNGRIVARTFKDILIQTHLPEEHFRTVAIHELTHAWFFYHNYRDLPLIVEEGLCVLMEYIWLRSQKNQDARFRRTMISQSLDPIYGDGFRKARQALELMPLKVLLKYVKEKKKFPGKLAAFFYH